MSSPAPNPADASCRPAAGLLALALLILLLPYLEVLLGYWITGPNYAAASVLAFLGAAITGHRQRQAWRQVTTTGRTVVSVLLVAVAVAMLVTSLVLLPKKSLAGLAVAGLIAALCYGFRGWRGVWVMRYPLTLLACASPFPGRLSDWLNQHLVDLVTNSASTALGWCVNGIERHGSLISIPGRGTVQVIPDCSGLDGVVLFLPMAITVLYFHPRLRCLSKLLFLALSVPLALLGNFLRVFLTGLLQAKDIQLTWSSTFHEWLGIATLGLALLILLLLPRWLWKTPEPLTS